MSLFMSGSIEKRETTVSTLAPPDREDGNTRPPHLKNTLNKPKTPKNKDNKNGRSDTVTQDSLDTAMYHIDSAMASAGVTGDKDSFSGKKDAAEGKGGAVDDTGGTMVVERVLGATVYSKKITMNDEGAMKKAGMKGRPTANAFKQAAKTAKPKKTKK